MVLTVLELNYNKLKGLTSFLTDERKRIAFALVRLDDKKSFLKILRIAFS